MKTLACLSLIIFLPSCGSLAKVSVPKLENRTLRISQDKAGFYYDYCLDYSFWSKTCQEWKTDFYDFNKKEDRDKLNNMGFKLRVIKR